MSTPPPAPPPAMAPLTAPGDRASLCGSFQHNHPDNAFLLLIHPLSAARVADTRGRRYVSDPKPSRSQILSGVGLVDANSFGVAVCLMPFSSRSEPKQLRGSFRHGHGPTVRA